MTAYQRAHLFQREIVVTGIPVRLSRGCSSRCMRPHYSGSWAERLGRCKHTRGCSVLTWGLGLTPRTANLSSVEPHKAHLSCCPLLLGVSPWLVCSFVAKYC